jgi:hypothetical protein
LAGTGAVHKHPVMRHAPTVYVVSKTDTPETTLKTKKQK